MIQKRNNLCKSIFHSQQKCNVQYQEIAIVSYVTINLRLRNFLKWLFATKQAHKHTAATARARKKEDCKMLAQRELFLLWHAFSSVFCIRLFRLPWVLVLYNIALALRRRWFFTPEAESSFTLNSAVCFMCDFYMGEKFFFLLHVFVCDEKLTFWTMP